MNTNQLTDSLTDKDISNESISGDDNSENIKVIINELYNDNNNIEESIHTGDNSYDSDETYSKDLDTSWITEHERLYSINENYVREPMDSINAYFVYINRNQYIEKIISDKLDLVLSSEGKTSFLSNETLLKIIQERKIKTPFSKYKLIDVISYLVNLEPENIQSYANSENIDNIKNDGEVGTTFLKVLSIMDNIQIDSSIFIFHGINSIYFFFEEVEIINHRHTLKSILKPAQREGSGSVSDKNLTKKVRIQEGGVINKSNYKRNKNNHGTRRRIGR